MMGLGRRGFAGHDMRGDSAPGETTMSDLLIRDVRPLGGGAVDIVIRSGRIAEHGGGAGLPVLEGGGRIALPGADRGAYPSG